MGGVREVLTPTKVSCVVSEGPVLPCSSVCPLQSEQLRYNNTSNDLETTSSLFDSPTVLLSRSTLTTVLQDRSNGVRAEIFTRGYLWCAYLGDPPATHPRDQVPLLEE